MRLPLRPRQAVALFAPAIAGLLVVVVGLDLWREHEADVQFARSTTHNLARVLEEHARQSLRRVDLGLRTAADYVVRARAARAPNDAELREDLKALLSADGLVRVLGVTGSDGRVRIAVPDKSIVGLPSVAGQDFFTAHRDRSDALRVMGAPVRGGDPERRLLPVSRRLPTADGSFGGIVFALVDPSYFQDFYDSLDTGANGFVTLFLRDGWIAVRSPHSESILARRWDDSPLFREHLPKSPADTVRQVVAADQVERIYSYRALQDYPVVVTTGISLTDGLAAWRARVLRDGLLLLVTLAGIAAAAVLFNSQLARREAVEAALRRSEERLRVIADNVPALVAYVEADERYSFNNRVYEEWLGMSRDQITGRTIREVWGEERYAMLQPNVARALRGERVSYEYAVLEKGVERHVLASYVPDFDADGRVKGFFLLGSDITSQIAARDELRAARERLENALDGSSAALWDWDLRTGRVYQSEAWAEIVGNPRGDTLTTGEELLQLVHPDDLEAVRRIFLETMKGIRAAYAFEHRVRARSGEWKWILSRGRVTERDPATGRAQRMIGTNIDITDRKRMEEALQSAAHSDPLTGLANRMLLGDRMRLALARSRRSGSACALLYLDIDGFKPVNDTLGHAAGDRLLKDFAERLRGCVRQADTVARLGGDEFVVLLEDLKDQASAKLVAEKMLECARAPTRIDGNDIQVTTSIGIAYSGDDVDEEAWLKRADAAMYEAKGAGRDQFLVAQ